MTENCLCVFLWLGMAKDLAAQVSCCIVCQCCQVLHHLFSTVLKICVISLLLLAQRFDGTNTGPEFQEDWLA